MGSLKSGIAATLGLIVVSLAGIGAARADDNGPMPAREQIDRSFVIAPGAKVSISSIAGPVTVETGGSGRAEIHILREAGSKRELDCTRTEIEARNGGLSLRQIRRSQDNACRDIRTRQNVRLIVPRNVDLSLDSIAGRLEIGEVDGAVKLSSIAGRTRVAGARSAEISSVAGQLMLGLGPIGRGGVQVSSVAGSVELMFRRGTSADVAASSLIGQMTSASPAIQVRREQRSYRARIGSGGPLVSLSSIVGQVRLSIS